MTQYLYATASFYSIEACRKLPNLLFVFGDNLDRVGNGGQAIIRGEPNTLGIATKRSCGEFMTGTLADVQAVLYELNHVERLLRAGQSMIFPILEDGKTSLGCGLAELPIRAPALYGLINDWFDRLPNVRRVRLAI